MGIFSKREGLKVPPPAAADSNAYECARIWITQGAPAFSIEKIKEIDDPGAWGSILADLAYHAANLHSAEGERPSAEALSRIQGVFNSLLDGWVKQASKST